MENSRAVKQMLAVAQSGEGVRTSIVLSFSFHRRLENFQGKQSWGRKLSGHTAVQLHFLFQLLIDCFCMIFTLLSRIKVESTEYV